MGPRYQTKSIDFKKVAIGAVVVTIVLRLQLTIASVHLLRMSFLSTSLGDIRRLEFIKFET